MAIILILDDRATNRNIYARLATVIEDGVTAEVFAEPLDALEWLEHNRVDLVITDYKMPGMDGAEFTRRFRAMPGCLHVPVVVITAHADRSFRLRALDAGATDFLQSPIDHFELVTRARNLLALGRRAPGAEAPRLHGPEDLARILDAIPALVSLADREGRCLYANAVCVAESGAPLAELLGCSVTRLFGPERGETSRLRDISVFESGRPLPAYREEILGPDGGRRWLLTTKTPLHDASGGIAAVLTTSFEVAEPMPGWPGQMLPDAAPGPADAMRGSAHG